MGLTAKVEGNCDNNNWSQWESTQRPPHKPPTVKGGQKSGAACDHWNRVEQDTQLIKDLGVGSYRFSQRMYDEYGSKAALQTAGTCVKNMLKSHVTIYFAIKQAAEDAGREVHVGIVKDLFQFHAFQWHNLFDHFLAWAMDQIFNVQIINFLRTGKFRFWVPFAACVSYMDSRAPAANDFIGLNYYSHYYVSLWNIITEPVLEAKLMALPQEIMTDMPQCVYPEGLYSALKTMATLGKPIIVTENGIADKHDDRRYLYIRRYLYALSRAIQDGVDVIGYYYWSLYDNFEWCEGYHMKFGLYAVNFDTQERSLRPAAAAFTNVHKAAAAYY
ncbi:glycoside hydrolase superfamily [Tribonema minus]|uniref:beta-glucosidase n=1 Tax=Tribonema minus TaxID=303371 RepID=A0A836CK19_9STRA|nr:glycoside hydrolase superfamily [Tribonema minus]